VPAPGFFFRQQKHLLLSRISARPEAIVSTMQEMPTSAKIKPTMGTNRDAAEKITEATSAASRRMNESKHNTPQVVYPPGLPSAFLQHSQTIRLEPGMASKLVMIVMMAAGIPKSVKTDISETSRVRMDRTRTKIAWHLSEQMQATRPTTMPEATMPPMMVPMTTMFTPSLDDEPEALDDEPEELDGEPEELDGEPEELEELPSLPVSQDSPQAANARPSSPQFWQPQALEEEPPFSTLCPKRVSELLQPRHTQVADPTAILAPMEPAWYCLAASRRSGAQVG